MHRYEVDHEVVRTKDGRQNYWRLVCRDCPWRGKRITKPSIVQSKNRMLEWDDHRKLTAALEEEE